MAKTTFKNSSVVEYSTTEELKGIVAQYDNVFDSLYLFKAGQEITLPKGKLVFVKIELANGDNTYDVITVKAGERYIPLTRFRSNQATDADGKPVGEGVKGQFDETAQVSEIAVALANAAAKKKITLLAHREDVPTTYLTKDGKTRPITKRVCALTWA